MRRRKQQRVVWLPPQPENSVTGVTTTSWGTTPLLPVSGSEPTANVEVPLTIDAPTDPATSTLSDIENSGYRLRRIVGKIFIIGDQLDSDSGIPLIGVTAGLIIRKVDQNGVSLASQVGTNQSSCSPSELENIPDPWIWRRSWLIFNPALFPVEANGQLAPWNNTQLSGTFDGAHVDQKTARIVGPEERLFLDVSATALLGVNEQSEITNITDVIFELRCLASMRTSSGNRRNAAR